MENLVTKRGYERLLKEKEIIEELLKEAKVRMGEAGSEGGWHENNPFETAEEQVHILTRRLMKITELVRKAKIVEDSKKRSAPVTEISTDQPKVKFGSVVKITIDGKIHKYKILGEADSDVPKGIISCTSPLGQAVLDKAEGDEVRMEIPEGAVNIKILKIQ